MDGVEVSVMGWSSTIVNVSPSTRPSLCEEQSHVYQKPMCFHAQLLLFSRLQKSKVVFLFRTTFHFFRLNERLCFFQQTSVKTRQSKKDGWGTKY